jgi:glycogen synthase
MKLLVYSHFFAPSIGGVETIVLSLAKGLADLEGERFDVTVATQTPAGQFPDNSLPFKVVRQPGVFQLGKLICGSDVVHLSGPSLLPMIIAKLAGKPLVIEHHGFQTICPNGQMLLERQGTPCPGHYMAGRYQECLRCNSAQGWVASLRLWLLTFVRRFFSTKASVNIVPTAWLGSMLHLPRITQVPHGIAVSQVRAASVCTDPAVVAFQGRLVTTKGVKLLLEAARELRNQNREFQMLIIGDGPERDRLEEAVRQYRLSDSVHLLGGVSSDELATVLNRASMVVVPSVGGEVFGLVILENMARSLPVIASDLGAFIEVMGDTGLTFRTGDARDLATTVIKLLNTPELGARLGQRARQRAIELYSVESMIKAHSRLYWGLLAAAGPAAHRDAWQKIKS